MWTSWIYKCKYVDQSTISTTKNIGAATYLAGVLSVLSGSLIPRLVIGIKPHPTKNDMCLRLSILNDQMIIWSREKTKQSKNAWTNNFQPKWLSTWVNLFIIAPGPQGSSRHFLSRSPEPNLKNSPSAGGVGPSFSFRIWFRQGRPSTLRLFFKWAYETNKNISLEQIIGASEPTNDGWK